jgi:hypothetical protein
MSLLPNSAALSLNETGGMPRIMLPDGRILLQPHVEWFLHQIRWRWLVDSWEGGEAYRIANYGFDLLGMPIRNLIRHKREYPLTNERGYSPQTGRPPGTDAYAQATDDDYELRRARTPVPGFLAEVVERHTGKIYKKEVDRDGPDEITAWWLDVDGKGTSIDQWMTETIGPLLLVLGQLDIVLDHPAVPKDEQVNSRADEIRLGLDSVVASYILPENVLWWCLDARGRYKEVLIREVQDNQEVLWRYWNKDLWCLYNCTGTMVESEYRPYGYDVNGQPLAPVRRMQETAAPRGNVVYHDYGVVPILRIFDRRRPRCRNVGLPRYEMIAEQQREYYNRDSELILSDTTQAHPLMQAPAEYVSPDSTIPIGPGWVLPKMKVTAGNSVHYEGFDVIEFPKGSADSIRLNKHDLRDAVDRLAGLTKPAGAQGSSGQTVSQSGISKQLDATTGHDLLGNISKTLKRVEETIRDLFWLVHGNGNPNEVAAKNTKIEYPAVFDLYSTEELAAAIIEFQAIMSSASGEFPETEGELYTALLKLMLPGLDDDKYKTMDQEIRDYLQTKADAAEAGREMTSLSGMMDGTAPGAPPANPAATPPVVTAHPVTGKTLESVTAG